MRQGKVRPSLRHITSAVFSAIARSVVALPPIIENKAFKLILHLMIKTIEGNGRSAAGFHTSPCSNQRAETHQAECCAMCLMPGTISVQSSTMRWI